MNTKILLVSLIALTGAAIFFASQGTRQQTASVKSEKINLFASFRSQFAKEYNSSEELEYRFGVYLSNLEMIEQHNADLSSTYKLGVNEFTDLTFEEFTAKYLGAVGDLEGTARCEKSGEESVIIGNDANEVDWTKQAGVVHAVKNQAACGSCWAFASTAALESAFAIFKGQKDMDLSEQELVDCSKKYGNNGCGGGLMSFAYDYVLDKGINNGKDYSYTAKNGQCKPISGKGANHLKGCRQVAKGVSNIPTAVAKQPVAVAFFVQNDFMHYAGGIYNPKGCKSQPNHAVTVVGYKLDDKVPNFRIKNSWGTAWGDKGYFNMAVGSGNGTCNIGGHTWNYYPVV